MKLYKCKVCRYTFTKFAEQLVMWSKKAEKCCPSCGMPSSIGEFIKIEKREKEKIK